MFDSHHNDIFSHEGILRFFREVWNSTEDNLFIVLKSPEGDYITEASNPALIDLFKLTPEQASGAKLKEILPAEIYQSVAARYDACFAQNRPLNYDEAHDVDNTGEMRYWRTMLLPFTDPNTAEQRIFGISREFSELKRYEEKLLQANEKLEAEVEQRTQELKHALKEMERISIIDKLTDIYNRHKLDYELHKELLKAERYGDAFGVLLLDIDNFKQINDSLGHQTGDQVLIDFAQQLKHCLRETDTLGRWGGDEFLVIAPNSNAESLTILAQKIKASLANHSFRFVEGVKSSMGLTLIKQAIVLIRSCNVQTVGYMLLKNPVKT